jgi:hypothetical protein
MDNLTVADALLNKLIDNAHRLQLQGESQCNKTLEESDEMK